MKMAYVLGVALVGAAAAGFVVDRARKQSSIANEPATAAAAAAPAPASPQADQTPGSALTGKVLETIDVPNYTYLHLDTGSAKVWAAVPQVKVDKGSTVTVSNAMKMRQFRSSTLKRTFDVIYFGSLGDGAGSASAGKLPAGHPDVGSGNPMAGGLGQGMPQGHPQVGAADPAPADLPKVDKAKGKNAKRIGDILAARKKFAGKLIRVRGVVVKVTPGVKGKTFLHLRDGTGDAAKHENDLAATTQAVPKQNDTITLEGTLGTDVDIGIGYHYPALLQDAKVVDN